MLIIKHHPERPVENGQFYLGIALQVSQEFGATLKEEWVNRLGYFCDVAHLESTIRLLQHQLAVAKQTCPTCGHRK